MASKRNSEKQVIASSGAAAVPVRRKSVSTKRSTARTTVEVSSNPVSEPEGLAIGAPEPVVLAAVSAEHHRDAVARLAYSYWAARGYQGGSPEADWLRAEQEISAK